MDKKKMMGFMMDMCCRGMTDEERRKVEGLCRDMAGHFTSCCEKMDISSFMKHCFPETASEKPKT